MSKESALKFAQAAIADNELRERTAKMEPDKLLPIAKELGYDFTEEELTEVMNEDKELTPDDFEASAGGRPSIVSGALAAAKNKHCYNDLNGPLHDWVVTGHEERWCFWAWTRGYDLLKCTRCGKTSERSV